MIESQRLSYIQSHKKKLRAQTHKDLIEATLSGGIELSSRGKSLIIPQSFTEGARNDNTKSLLSLGGVGYMDKTFPLLSISN